MYDSFELTRKSIRFVGNIALGNFLFLYASVVLHFILATAVPDQVVYKKMICVAQKC